MDAQPMKKKKRSDGRQSQVDPGQETLKEEKDKRVQKLESRKIGSLDASKSENTIQLSEPIPKPKPEKYRHVLSNASKHMFFKILIKMNTNANANVEITKTTFVVSLDSIIQCVYGKWTYAMLNYSILDWKRTPSISGGSKNGTSHGSSSSSKKYISYESILCCKKEDASRIWSCMSIITNIESYPSAVHVLAATPFLFLLSATPSQK